ncbi:Putative inner membrane protein [Archangium gephyra]|uniref:Inner membrane protein n=1 Tax=Archangium gephyra TaxID=48 RepID=A0AAC8Q291_9BACT|nr:Putative inner membrane protein [Archangium gephyra]
MLVPLLVWAAPHPSQESAAQEEPGPVFNWKPGPRKVELGHELTLDLPEEHLFLEKAEAAKLMEMNGSFYNDNLLGVVTSKDESSSWVVIVRYEDEGYIKDDEEIDAKELLTAIKEGTEEANKERVERGFKPLHVKDWSESPHYDKARHHLIWALDAFSDNGTSVNYSTRVLGRRGYVSMNLVVDPVGLADSKPHMSKLLASTQFNPGARYEDFQEGTDKVAEFGLAGLVLGGAGLGAAKLAKVGILAKFGKFFVALLLAGKKAIIPLLLAIGALVSKLFGGKKTEAAPPPANPGE